MTPDITIHFPLAQREGLALEDFLRMNETTDRFLSDNPYHIQLHRLIKWWCETDHGMEVKTSGTTGVPKVLHFNRKQILSAALSSKAILGPNKGDSALLAIDPAFTGGRMLVIRSLINGTNLTCLPAEANPLQTLINLKIPTTFSYASLVPYQAHRIFQNDSTRQCLSHIQTLLIGGAPVAERDWDELCQLPNRIFHTFGMTETLSHVALRINKSASRDYEIIPEVDVYLDERQCLVIQSPWLDEVVTNDMAEWTDNALPHRRFRWLGRADRLINSGGHLINPELTEAAFESFTIHEKSITGFFAAGEKNEELGHQLILVVETNEGSESLRSRINDYCVSAFSRLDRPRRVLFTENMEMTVSGKIDRLATMRKLGCSVD